MLVHCNAGVSRSASTVIAFLMWSGLCPSYEAAVLHVRERRICINPSNFEGELLEWERSHGCPEDD